MDQYEKDKVLLFKTLNVSSYKNVNGHRADELLDQILVTHQSRNIANCRDEDGRSPLHVAIICSAKNDAVHSRPQISALLEAGAKVSYRQENAKSGLGHYTGPVNIIDYASTSKGDAEYLRKFQAKDSCTKPFISHLWECVFGSDGLIFNNTDEKLHTHTEILAAIVDDMSEQEIKYYHYDCDKAGATSKYIEYLVESRMHEQFHQSWKVTWKKDQNTIRWADFIITFLWFEGKSYLLLEWNIGIPEALLNKDPTLQYVKKGIIYDECQCEAICEGPFTNGTRPLIPEQTPIHDFSKLSLFVNKIEIDGALDTDIGRTNFMQNKHYPCIAEVGRGLGFPIKYRLIPTTHKFKKNQDLMSLSRLLCGQKVKITNDSLLYWDSAVSKEWTCKDRDGFKLDEEPRDGIIHMIVPTMKSVRTLNDEIPKIIIVIVDPETAANQSVTEHPKSPAMITLVFTLSSLSECLRNISIALLPYLNSFNAPPRHDDESVNEVYKRLRVVIDSVTPTTASDSVPLAVARLSKDLDQGNTEELTTKTTPADVAPTAAYEYIATTLFPECKKIKWESSEDMTNFKEAIKFTAKKRKRGDDTDTLVSYFNQKLGEIYNKDGHTVFVRNDEPLSFAKWYFGRTLFPLKKNNYVVYFDKDGKFIGDSHDIGLHRIQTYSKPSIDWPCNIDTEDELYTNSKMLDSHLYPEPCSENQVEV